MLRGRLGHVAGVLVVALVVALIGAIGASAATVSFTSKGCQNWQIPLNAVNVKIHAVGAAGENGASGFGNAGGAGDGYSATLNPPYQESGEAYVCVDVGGGAKPGGITTGGGEGGGASGVGIGSAFENPYVLAAGGGGGGYYVAGAGYVGGAAASEGVPLLAGLSVSPREGAITEQLFGGGGAGKTTGAGAGGQGKAIYKLPIAGGGTETGCTGEAGQPRGLQPGSGGKGCAVTASLAGGSGGAGYFGGGGGGAFASYSPRAFGAGGGGGADFCGSGATECTRSAGEGTVHGVGVSAARVTIEYQIPANPTESPKSQTVVEGASATMKGNCIGDPAPSLEWYVSTNGGVSYTAAGVKTTEWKFTATSALNGSKYYLRCTNSVGDEITNIATLTVEPKPQPCAPGSFSVTGLTPCIPAPAGTFASGAGEVKAKPCLPGSYQPLEGQTSCLLASAGNFVALTKQAAQTPCPAGSFQPLTGQSSCQNATPGNFVSLPGQAAQTPCPAGSFQPASGQQACLNAESGHYVASSEQSSQVECVAGSYQPLTGQSSCLLAGVGYFVSMSGSAAEAQCPVGMTTAGTGSTSEAACIPKPFEIETTSLPGATRGSSYEVVLHAAYGTLPYKWKKIGKLPKGLKMSSSGVISGIPSTKLLAGTYVVTVEVADKAKPKHTAKATFELLIS